MSLTISPARIVEESGSPLLAARDSWERRPLGEVATILNGFAFKSKDFVPAGGKPLIRIRDIFNEHTAVGYAGEYESRYLVQPGDLLVGMDGDFNCTQWRGPEALLNQRVCKITPSPEQLDFGFLLHLLPGYLQAIHDLTSSTTVTHLSSRDIAQIPIPVPPVDEQRELARLFGVAALKQRSSASHIEAARQAIERFRQAAVAAACTGRLTADWREARGEGGQIDDAMPSTWKKVTLGALASTIRGGSTEVPSDKPSDFPILRSSSVRPFAIDYGDVRFLSAAQSKRAENFLQEGDLLITRLSGSIAYVGNCALVRARGDPSIQYPDRLFRCHLNDQREAPYVELAFAGPQVRDQILAASRSAAGHQRISISDLREFSINHPPLDEQVEIVQRVHKLLALTDELKERIEAASRRVDRSSHAVRAKALRGELSAQSTSGGDPQ